MDFVTSLPPSNGHTVILTIVDHFSKSAHSVPLPKLPSAAETGALLVLHIFRVHGTVRHNVIQGPTVHLPGLEILLRCTLGGSEPLIRLPPTV